MQARLLQSFVGGHAVVENAEGVLNDGCDDAGAAGGAEDGEEGAVGMFGDEGGDG